MMNCKPKVWAEIDISALLHNYNLIQKQIGNAQQICVVKADCYGHGVASCLPALANAGCSFFAVSSLQEALQVRNYTDGKILILGYTEPCDIPCVIENNITQALFSHDYFLRIKEYIPKGKRLKTHIKLDTGMNRIGYGFDEISYAISDAKSDLIEMNGLFSHFACADEKKPNNTDKQLAKFIYAKKELEQNGVNIKMTHICNSSGAFYIPDAHFDAVRSGISLYGMSPSDQTPVHGIMPVMTLKTVVAHIHTLYKGESVSYGGEYTAKEDRIIATLPIGYGDGFIRAYRDSFVTINGKKAPIVGRICMDQCMVDITEFADEVRCGDEAVMFGEGGQDIDKLAKMANTINYECTCLITKRVERINKE